MSEPKWKIRISKENGYTYIYVSHCGTKMYGVEECHHCDKKIPENLLKIRSLLSKMNKTYHEQT